MKGEVKGRREMVITFIQARFPVLVEQARKKVKQLVTADELQHLLQQLVNASDEDAARVLLT